MRERLNQLNDQIQQTIGTMTNYNKQKYMTKTETLFKLIEGKKNSLSADKFEFKGEPIVLEQSTSEPVQPHFKIEPYIQEEFEKRIVLTDQVNHLLVKDLKQCVMINDHKSLSINLYQAAESILKFNIDGTITLTNISNCILELNCHQLRLHGLKNCLILTNISSEIILEDCEQLKFNNKVQINDFNFNFSKSANYEFVQVDEKQLAWTNDNSFDKGLFLATLNSLLR